METENKSNDLTQSIQRSFNGAYITGSDKIPEGFDGSSVRDAIVIDNDGSYPVMDGTSIQPEPTSP